MGSRSKVKVGSRATSRGRQFKYKRRSRKPFVSKKALAALPAPPTHRERRVARNQRKRFNLDLLFLAPAPPPLSRRQRIKKRKTDQRAKKAAARAAAETSK